AAPHCARRTDADAERSERSTLPSSGARYRVGAISFRLAKSPIEPKRLLALRAGLSAPSRRPALLIFKPDAPPQTSQAAVPICPFHHDLARGPSDFPNVRGHAILWCGSGRSHPFKVAANSPTTRNASDALPG